MFNDVSLKSLHIKMGGFSALIKDQKAKNECFRQ